MLAVAFASVMAVSSLPTSPAAAAVVGRPLPGDCDGLINTSYSPDAWLQPKTAVVPVCLLTQGHMGSSVTAALLGDLANAAFVSDATAGVAENAQLQLQQRQGNKNWGQEAEGSHGSIDGNTFVLFREIPSPQYLFKGDVPNQVRAFMGESCRRVREAGLPRGTLVGFKWLVTTNASHNMATIPDVLAPTGTRVVVLTRNYLDHHTSAMRRRAHMDTMPVHCVTGHEGCLKNAESQQICLHPQKFVEHERRYRDLFHQHFRLLEQHGVNYTVVTYRQLYMDPNRLEHWQYLLRFIGSPAADTVTLERLGELEIFAKTTQYDQRQIIVNYDEVAAALRDTPLDYLLHGTPRYPVFGKQVRTWRQIPECANVTM